MPLGAVGGKEDEEENKNENSGVELLGPLTMKARALCEHEDFTSLTANPGTLPYMAPELFVGRADTFDLRKRADVYAFAIVVNAQMDMKMPYLDSSGEHFINVETARLAHMRAAERNRNDWSHSGWLRDPTGTLRPQLATENKWCPSAVLDMICECWHQDPKERPSFKNICRRRDLVESTTPKDKYMLPSRRERQKSLRQPSHPRITRVTTSGTRSSTSHVLSPLPPATNQQPPPVRRARTSERRETETL